MKRVLIIFFVLMSLDSLSQDPHFSQYCETPLFLNPANTGLKNNTRAIINYRNQWAAVSTPYQTTALSYDMSLTKDNLANAWVGLGTNIYYDWAGDGNLSLTQGNLNLSGVIRLDAENKLSAGLMGGYGQRSLDYNEFRWQAQYNGTYNPNLNSNEDYSQNAFGYFDAGAGVAWSVTVTNVGEAQIDGLVLVLDEAWSAPIQRLRLDRMGNDSGVEHPAGLTAGETLVVRSSHDITNHHLLRNAADEPYPPDRVPRVVGLESAGSRGVWRVR